MVDSPGIRSRRPASFEYSDYLTPEAFMPVAAHLGRTRGGEDDGRALVVQADGSWSHAPADRPPPSQSRALCPPCPRWPSERSRGACLALCSTPLRWPPTRVLAGSRSTTEDTAARMSSSPAGAWRGSYVALPTTPESR